MPRRKKTTVRTEAAGPSDAARRELWTGVDDVLTFANKHIAQTWTEAEATFRPFGETLHYTLISFSAGGSGQFRGWPLWAVLGANNLKALTAAGGFYLRRCRECDLWFLARDRRRVRCYRADCAKAAGRQRTAAARRREFEQQRRARERLRRL